MDDLLALFEESPVEENEASEFAPPQKRQRQQDTSSNGRAKAGLPLSPSHKLALSVDDRVGIRMINRRVSGLDLMNMITDHPYHSPAQLASYSLAQLNRLLLDPASVIDPATVCGKTELVSVGLVFSNSGTRIASSGNAFCIVAIGNQKTGKAISCMLFGSSYGKLCRSCVAGKVVALINPRLIPSRDKGETSVSFSVNDESQLVVVADARDFAFCKGMTKSKNGNGQWIANGKSCRNFVDKRMGEFCAKHRNQATQVAGRGCENAGGKGTGMARLRMESSAFPTAQGRIRQTPGQIGMPPATRAGFCAPVTQNRQSASVKSFPKPATRTSNTLENRKLAGNSLLNPIKRRTTAQANCPRGRTTTLESNLTQKSGAGSLRTTNPYARPRTHLLPTKKATPTNKSKTQSRVVTSDILQGKKKQAKNAKRRAVNVNTDVRGYNGSVAVPAPSKIFQRMPGSSNAAAPNLSLRRTALSTHERSAAAVVARQQEVAALLQERSSTGRVVGNTRARIGRSSQLPLQASASAALFDSLGEIDFESVVAAKSHFSNEADAEEYARSRVVVGELEKEEAKKNGSKSKKNDENKSATIQKEWLCLHCKRSFRDKPIGCTRLGHKVKLERKIKKSQSIGEQRLAMTERDAEDGGLCLGRGLDWSRWNRG